MDIIAMPTNRGRRPYDCVSNWDMTLNPSNPEDTVIVLRYEDHSGPADFAKRLLLRYPLLQPTQQMHLVVPKHAHSSLEFAHFIGVTSPNVTIFNETPSHAPPERVDLVLATQQLLQQHGVVNPFDTGFQFPEHILIEIEKDLGVSPDRLAEIDEVVLDSEFCSHMYTRNELLCVLFLLFRRLVADPQVSPELKKNDEELLYFLAVCRAMYKAHLPFHTLWHCVDVTQFTVSLLLKQDLPWQLTSNEKLGLSLAALGHDMLHAGLMTPALHQFDPGFVARYGSLEIYHSRIFRNVLLQLWPATNQYWEEVIRQGIEATELSKHKQYLDADADTNVVINFVHVLKISDFASAARFAKDQYDLTAQLIFQEFQDQSEVCGEPKCEARELCDQNKSRSLNEMQVGFLSKLVIPYFEWLVSRVPLFKQFLDRAKQHLDRYIVLTRKLEVS